MNKSRQTYPRPAVVALLSVALVGVVLGAVVVVLKSSSEDSAPRPAPAAPAPSAPAPPPAPLGTPRGGASPGVDRAPAAARPLHPGPGDLPAAGPRAVAAPSAAGKRRASPSAVSTAAPSHLAAPAVAKSEAPASEPAADSGPPPFGVDRDGIRAAIRDAVPAIRECYDSWVRLDNKLQGRLSVRFTITRTDDGAEGRVTEASLQDSQLGQPFMEGCVLNVFQGLRFQAPPEGRTEVRYPLMFRSAGNESQR